MQKILEGSFIYRFIAAVCSWVGRQWRENRVIARFLSPGPGEQISDSSIFTRLWLGFHRWLCKVFKILRLDRLLNNSIFTMPFIWCLIALGLAPVLPTMAVLGISIVCIGSLLLAFGCDPQKRLSYSPVNKYILLLTFIYIVATFTSVTLSGSLLGGSLTALFFLFTIVIQNSVATRRQLDTLVFIFVMSGAVVSAYGIYQYLFGTIVASGWVDSTMFSGIGIRVYSTLDNPNVLSEYLLLAIPFALASILIVKRAVFKVFFTGCLAVMLLCMLLTFARGGWLGLIIALAIFLIMLDRRFIIIGIVGLVLLYFLLPDVILNRFLSIGDTSDSSTTFRVSIWLGTIAMLRDYWFTGIGPGVAAFNKVYPFYSFNTVYAPHSHNLYLQMMCDAGISGIIIFLAVLFTWFRNMCTSVLHESIAIKRPGGALSAHQPSPPPDCIGADIRKQTKILQIASISAVIGFLIQGVTDFSFYNYRVTLVFWIVLGLGALIARRSQLEEGGAGLVSLIIGGARPEAGENR